MAKIALYLLIGLAAGFAVAMLTGQRDGSGRPIAAESLDTGALERRITALEASLDSAERQREALADRLDAVAEQVTAFDSAAEPLPLRTVDDDDDSFAPEYDPDLESDDDPGPAGPGRRLAFGGRRIDIDPATRIARLVEAGLTQDRAEFVIQRTEELRMELLQARYDAVRDGVPASLRAGLDLNAALRSEIGDSDYEKYLAGMGRPTRIGVGTVLSNSPAEQAGLKPGDQIVSYAGQRVFDMNDLTSLSYEGQPGAAVAVQVVRDGQTIQLYIPRGPLGITGSGRFFRRP